VRTLITGGAGFIGSHLCDRFLAEGHEVVAVDNFITGTPENIAHMLGNPKFKLIGADISHPLKLRDKVDNVLHFASLASPADYLDYPIQTLKVGSLGTHNTLGIARAHGARYLLASTSEVYGDPLEHPQTESYWGNVNCVGVRGCYDESKRFAESMTMAYHRVHNVDTKIVRIFNTYGERMRLNDGRVLPNFMHQALTGQPITVYGDGKQTRSFQYVSDLVEGIWRLLSSDYHEPVNIGNPAEITILEFAEEVKKLAGASSEIVFRPLPQDDPKIRQPDITLARKLLGWEPKVGRAEGCRRTMEYFRGKIRR
jgi:dTDP-glucose 4,6-dehydratase